MVSVNEQTLNEIKKDLKENHPELYLDAFSNMEARKILEDVLRKTHKTLLSDDERLEYVIQETVGLGVIDEILNKYPSVTDISYNGTDLRVETPYDYFIYDKEIKEEKIIKIIQQFANAVGKEFTPKDSILDSSLNNLRLNSVHKVNSPYGTTMSLRATKPKLALNEENFEGFAPLYILELFKAMVAVGSNIFISGETGTGKTELQKLLLGFISNDKKIVTIEDTLEGHFKTLYPEKDIMSWITSETVSISDLIKSALRNNPRWIIVSEIRDKAAYEMMQAVLSGHSVVTTGHTIGAKATPRRIVNMSKLGYQIDEKSFEADIYRYFDFGVHIKKKKIDGKTVRYLSEIVEYMEDGTTITLFEMKVEYDKFIPIIGKYSDVFKSKLLEYSINPKTIEPILPNIDDVN